jgi:hypothetical protein
MSNKDRYDLQLKAMADALSQSITDASDQEIQEDARLTGIDLDANAARLKQMLTDTAKRFHKRKFYEAQTAYSQEVQKIQSRSHAYQLPETTLGRRALLQSIAAQQAQRGIPLTVHGRDLEALPDSDVTSLLEELASLGMLPDDTTK